MTSFHTNLAFDQEWATPGEPLYVNRLSHAMLSCRAAFHESTLFAFFTPLKRTDRCGKPQFPHRTGGLAGSRDHNAYLSMKREKIFVPKVGCILYASM